MIISLVLTLIISISLLIIGIINKNADLINLAYSFVVGIITGILSSITITLYFRRKDKKTLENNIELLKRKSVLMNQYNALQGIAKVYLDIVLALQAYLYANPDLKSENGYFELCKTILNRPMGSIYEDTVITEDENYYVSMIMLQLSKLEELIINKDFTKIDITKEMLKCMEFNGRCMPINGRIQIELNQIEAKMKSV